MASPKTVVQYLVQWMLNASEALGGVVVLVVDVQVVGTHGLACLLAEQVVVNERLGGLAGKLHHHAGWRVGVHVGVLACDIVVLGVDDFQEQVASFCLTGDAAFVAIVDVALCYFLTGALHEFELHHILNAFHAHLALSTSSNVVGYALNECLVVAGFGCEHGFADCRFNFFFVVSNNSSITFYYCLYHNSI